MNPRRRTYRLLRILILLGAALFWMGPPRPPAPPGCRGPVPPHPFSEAMPAPAPTPSDYSASSQRTDSRIAELINPTSE